MEKEKIKNPEIAKEARQLIKKGISKQETFETLNAKYNSAKEVSDILKYIPSFKAVKKYGVWNYLLLCLLLLSALFFVSHKPSFGVFIWYGSLAYIVARMLVKYYVYVAFLSATTVISLIALILFFDSSKENWYEIGFILALAISTLILPFWLEKKLCPQPTETKELYINSEGQQRQRIVYGFTDL
jgi:hypothetical protein